MFDQIHQRRFLIPFRSQLLPHVFTDTLVIGGGVAGMRAAIEAAPGGDVILLAKDALDLSNTAWAQGGIAAARREPDTIDAHFNDTVRAGAGLCDPPAVRTLVEDANGCVDELLDWGMRFDRDDASNLSLGREGGHSHHRILHSGGAATGRELVRCLAARLRDCDSVRIFDRCFALDLLTQSGREGRGGSRVLGAITHHPRYGLQIVWARTTILASGGYGQLFRETTNPRPATGDGLAMAYRAGAVVGDVEFMQFHPTTLYIAGAERKLISEAVRGEGAFLVDHEGVRFMVDQHELADLAPRDVVSRAIVDRLAQSQAEAVFLDARHIGENFAKRFPEITRELRAFDLDPATDLIPVHPAAHYAVGGVWTDLDGRTNLPGLLACGEVACNGLHGANRLASNSLLEGLVYGRRAGRFAAQSDGAPVGPLKIVSDIPVSDHALLDLADVRSSLRSTMWRNVGIERHGPKLDDVLDMLGFWSRYTMDKIFDDPDGWEIQNLLLIGAIMTRAARWRGETRGVHCRTDCPAKDEAFACHALWRRGDEEPVAQPVAEPVESSA